MTKKQATEKELQQLWDANIGPLAYDLEEAFLEVFSKRGPEVQTPAFFLGAIAMAAGHVLQVSEKEFDYKHDLKAPFNDVLMQAYNHYRQHPSDEDDEAATMPKIDWSMLN